MLSGRLPLILVLVVGLPPGWVAQCQVKSLGIVAELDIAGRIPAGVFPRRVGGAVDPLHFERGIERFREGIIEAGTHSAHRLAGVSRRLDLRLDRVVVAWSPSPSCVCGSPSTRT